jgi:acyl carrier protein
MNIEAHLTKLVLQEIESAGGERPVELRKETILADTKLDSLGFATLIVAMKQEFQLDPFGHTNQINYVETFGELVSMYEEEKSRNGAT